MGKDKGVTPAGSGSRASHGAAKASPPKASIPNAVLLNDIATMMGEVADNMQVRLALMERVHSGEITLEAAQAELRRIKRGARKAGKVTRNQAFLGKSA